MPAMRRFVSFGFVIGSDARLLAGRYAKNPGAAPVLPVTAQNIIGAGREKDVADSPDRCEAVGRTPGGNFSAESPGEMKQDVIPAVRALRESPGCTNTLADRGASPGNIPEPARKAKRDPCHQSAACHGRGYQADV
jgi:alcohol dehydrogenase